MNVNYEVRWGETRWGDSILAPCIHSGSTRSATQVSLLTSSLSPFISPLCLTSSLLCSSHLQIYVRMLSLPSHRYHHSVQQELGPQMLDPDRCASPPSFFLVFFILRLTPLLSPSPSPCFYSLYYSTQTSSALSRSHPTWAVVAKQRMMRRWQSTQVHLHVSLSLSLELYPLLLSFHFLSFPFLSLPFLSCSLFVSLTNGSCLSSSLPSSSVLLTTTVSVRSSNPILQRMYLLFFSFLFFCFLFFCFVLFCFVLFCFVLFCFVLFCFCLLWFEYIHIGTSYCIWMIRSWKMYARNKTTSALGNLLPL